MSKYCTVFDPDARAELRAIELPIARRILAKLAELESDPYAFATTELVARPGVRRLGVGDYRIFYRVYEADVVVLVVRVAHRSVAY